MKYNLKDKKNQVALVIDSCGELMHMLSMLC